MTPQSPNDFNRPPQGGFNPEDRSPGDAYQTPPSPPPKRSSSKAWIWILAIVAIVLVGGVALCCGGGFFVFRMGAQQLTTQVQADIEDEPVIEEHIGDIESLELSLTKTGELGEQGQVVLTIEGSKGEGVIIGRQAPGGQRLSDLRLRMPDGQEYPLEQ